MSVESVQIPVEYIIRTTSDWTKFHIVEGGWWSNVEIKCLEGCDKLRLKRVIDDKIIAIDKRLENIDLVEVKAKCTLNIDKKHVNSQISHLITKGDLKSTTVRIIVGKEIERKTNSDNIAGDSHNPMSFNVLTSQYVSAFKEQALGIGIGQSIPDKLKSIETKVKQTQQAVNRIISTLEDKAFLRPKFVESSPAKRTFGDMVTRICRNILESGSEEVEMFIVGYFDQFIIDKLKSILAKKGKVKIISPELKLNRRDDKINLDALKRMEKNGAEVRIHPMLHAQIFYVSTGGQPWGVIIGSGDIKSDCIGGRRFDAGIWSNHPDVTSSTFDFFNRVWEDDRAMNLSEIR